MFDDKPWFAPKAFGFGAGLPIAWQGWAVIAAFAAAIVADGLCLTGAARIVVGAILAVCVLLISWAKTDGGWRWRRPARP